MAYGSLFPKASLRAQTRNLLNIEGLPAANSQWPTAIIKTFKL